MTRAEAKALGLRRYNTGKKCKRGHASERNTSTGNCRECMARYNADFYANNKDSERKRFANYYAGNAEYFGRYYRENRNKYQERAARYAIEKPGMISERRIKRRAAKMNAIPVWFGELDEFVTEEAGHLCKLREALTGFAWHVDHMIPLQARKACGLHCAANLQVIPGYLNFAKRNSMTLTEPWEWMKKTTNDGAKQ